ncbi:MAG: response regulator [Oligoflexia bacterium]|nr:response regulator [Oligoflexia bacterium]
MNKEAAQQPVKILLVDDEPADQELTLMILSKLDFPTTVACVADGEEALEYLYKHKHFANAATPDLILLDLNMPKIDGKEVLLKIKVDPLLKNIPIIVLTTFDAEPEIVATNLRHANYYLRKPLGIADFKRVADTINEIWLSLSNSNSN